MSAVNGWPITTLGGVAACVHAIVMTFLNRTTSTIPH